MKSNGKLGCLEDLRTRILTLDLQPGADLDESSLSETYGLSRTPLREVFQRLAGEGYLRLESNRGAKVASMDFGTMRSFFQTAPMIYAAAARLAAEHRTPDQLATLKQVQRAFRAACDAAAPGEMALQNHRFHALIGEMADNPYLAPSLGRLLIDHTRLSQMFYRPVSAEDRARVATSADQHDEMIAAIEQQAPARAVEATLRHWDLSRDRIERFVRPDPLPHDDLGEEARRDAV